MAQDHIVGSLFSHYTLPINDFLFFFYPQVLAEASKKIFSSVNNKVVEFIIDHKEIDAGETAKEAVIIDDDSPEWAQALEPVRKLPTNVGARIRRCIYESLSRNPPEWAKEILEHSISKEVYKGNASGPTKVLYIFSIQIMHNIEANLQFIYHF